MNCEIYSRVKVFCGFCSTFSREREIVNEFGDFISNVIEFGMKIGIECYFGNIYSHVMDDI